MKVSRRQFSSSLAGLFGGLVLFKGASASTVSPAAKKFNEHSYQSSPRGAGGTCSMRGKVASTPKLKHYLKKDGSSGCRMFFCMTAGATESIPCVVWGKLAYDLSYKMQIQKGTNLIVRGEPTNEGGHGFVTVTDVEQINGRLI